MAVVVEEEEVSEEVDEEEEAPEEVDEEDEISEEVEKDEKPSEEMGKKKEIIKAKNYNKNVKIKKTLQTSIAYFNGKACMHLMVLLVHTTLV